MIFKIDKRALILGLFLSSCGEVPEYKGSGKPQPAKTPVSSASAEQMQRSTSAEPSKTAVPGPKLTCDSPGFLKTDVVRVVIPKNNPKDVANRCPFGQNDNNSATNGNGKFTARIERKFPIDIPADRQVCGMKASGQEQNLEYDDHLFLTLNENLLISTGGIPNGGPTKGNNGFLLYEWEKFRGKGLPGSRFCAEGVTCKAPETQQLGKFSFELSDEANKRLFSSLVGKPLYLRTLSDR